MLLRLYAAWVWIALVASQPGVSSFQDDPVAVLDYGTFRGGYSKTFNISYWRKIPFAAPPVGANR